MPRCPANPKFRMEKRLSAFAIVGVTKKAKKEGGAEGEPDLDDPKVEAAMMEMEREMSGMDDENPDSRQLARMLRRMGDVTGQPLGGPMEEMIRRLEAGEDPEKIENDYGDLLDENLPGGPPGEEGVNPAAGPTDLIGRLRRAASRRAPRIDPELYELEEWLRRDRKAERRK